jgi:hypothetical protein
LQGITTCCTRGACGRACRCIDTIVVDPDLGIWRKDIIEEDNVVVR